MVAAVTLAPLLASHRTRIEEILRASKVFSEEEIVVALEVFDEGSGKGEAGRDGDPAKAPASPFLLPSSSYRLLGAFENDELVGYACYGATPGTEDTFDLYWIAVHPDAQSGGVGTLLLHEVERRLQGLSARMLVVETSSRSDYAPTRGFYGRRGYAESARVREFYAPGDDRIILTKRFHSPTAGGEQRHHE
jgi:ribosomal protein S18 acetylase RimI-like enzyme